MRVYLGSDHAGFELDNHLGERLGAGGHQSVERGLIDMLCAYETSGKVPPLPPHRRPRH